MKKKTCLALLVFCIMSLIIVTSFATDYTGQYGGLSEEGVFISMTLNSDGTAKTNILGLPISGSYTINKGIISISIQVWGSVETIQGKITEESIEFADVCLKKGVTSVEGEDVIDLLGEMLLSESNVRANIPQSIELTEDSTEYEKLSKAEELFAIGHYEEAIALYDEIASTIDVEERKSYALECKEIRDLYFEWEYNRSSSDTVYNGLVLKKYTGYAMEDVVVPYGTCGLSGWAFRDSNTDIISIQLPETLTRIPVGSLEGCTNLKTINIPTSLESIALDGTGIVELTIPATVKTIPSGAFTDCKKLKTVVFEGQPTLSLSYNGDGIFARCTSLESVTIPASFGRVPNDMFWKCSSLKNVVIKEGITSIGFDSFAECTQLESVELSTSISSIGNKAFRDCTALKEVYWPANACTIPSDCFRGCSSLANVIIPDTVTSIEEDAFADCISIHRLVLPAGVKAISSGAFGGAYDEDVRAGLTLVVKQGTYGHRYAEECGLSYIFEGDDETTRVPLGTVFTLGTYKGTPIRWVVIAHNGNYDLALSIPVLDKRAYNSSGGKPTYDDSEIKNWLETDFFDTAFSQSEKDCIKKVQLLPTAYFQTFVRKKSIGQDLLEYSSQYWNTAIWWLKEEYYFGKARVAFGESLDISDEPVTSVIDVRPAIVLSFEKLDRVSESGSYENPISQQANTNAEASEEESRNSDVLSEDSIPLEANTNVEELVYQSYTLARGQLYDVYSGPSTAYWRGAKGKAQVSTNDTVWCFGYEGDWLMIMYDTSKGSNRIGFIDSRKIVGNLPSLPILNLSSETVSLAYGVTVTDDLAKRVGVVANLSKGTEVTCLATYGDMAYIECYSDGKIARGFVPQDATR